MHDLAVDALFADRLGGVLHQVEEDLDELVARAQHVRQRRVVDIADADMAGEARLGEPFDVVEHRMNVEAFARDRPLVGKGLHAVDELDDAVGLLADQLRQRAILVADRGFQQLRGAANAGKRVLDLVREHRAERGDRPCRAAMGELPVHFFSN